MSQNIFTVTTLNNYIKHMFDSNVVLKGLSLRGEISNFKPYPSGHIYFTLKDKECAIKAIMYATYARNIPPSIKDGDEVIVSGYVSLYPTRGEYQIYVQSLELYGKGDQLLELEMLKKKLAAEGLFDASRKRELKKYPNVVGVISAPNSAALADIKINILRRNPLIELKIFPSLVQGSEAPKSLLNALNEAKNAGLDVLIIGRGGGAIEDLSAFNDETLVREAAKFPVPIISAVGHEIDYTLIDYIADARASTPTGAAELATRDKREIYESLSNIQMNLDDILISRINKYKTTLDNIKNRPFFINPKNMYVDATKDVENYSKRIDIALNHYLERNKEKIESLKARLKGLSVNNTLNRGFAIIKNDKGKILKDIKDVDLDENIVTTLANGTITSKVIGKEKING